MMGFMASRAGRWTRMLAGASLMVGGLSSHSGGGKALALVGLVPLLAGVLDVCLLAPLFGLPLEGKALRREIGVLGEDSLLPHPRPAQRPTLLH